MRLKTSSAIFMFICVALVMRPAFALNDNETTIVFSNAKKSGPLAFIDNRSSEEKALEKNIRLHLQKADVDLNNLNAKDSLTQVVTRALQALGYYLSTINIIINDSDVTIEVDPKSRLTWDTPDIEILGSAKDDSDIISYLQKNPIQQGAGLNQGDYEIVKRDLLEICQGNGYLDASYKTNELQIDLAKKQAKAKLVLDCDERFKLADIDFQGSSIDQSVLDVFKTNLVGEWYHRSQIRTLYQELADSGYFSTIEIERNKKKKIEGDHQAVILDAILQDVSPHQVLAGVGFGTDTGPRGRLQWDRPIVNQYGHSFFNALEVSKIRQTMTSHYRVPAPHPLYQFMEYQFGAKREDIQNKRTDIASLGVSWHKKYPTNWHRVMSLDFEHEQSQVENESKQEYNYLIPLITLSKTDQSRFFFIKRYRGWLTILTGSELLGAGTNFTRLQLGGKLLVPLVPLHSILLSSEWGVIKTSNLDEVPISKRFYTGGDQTVRGYEYEAIGSDNKLSDLIKGSDNELSMIEGGQYLNVASAEYDWQFKPAWQWAIFFDTGRAYIDPNERFSSGAGVGVRWLSPVGQLRFDIAQPVGNPDENSVRFHLFLGADL